MTDDLSKLKQDRNRIWFDTEFIEDGKTIELISIGLIRDDGATYYAEVQGVDYSRADPWLHENVIPHLQGSSAVKPRSLIAAEIVAFAGSKPEFWAYYADYDWVALCQLYGRMIDLPKGWPMFCRDLKQVAGDQKLPKQTGVEHHALADAIWTKAAHQSLALLSDSDTKDRRIEELEAGLRDAVRIAGEAAEEWDKAPSGMRAGKIILALAGHVPGYRRDTDTIHALLSKETQDAR